VQHRSTRGHGKGFVSGQTALTPCCFSSPEQHRDSPLGTSRTPLMHAGNDRASQTSCTPTNTRHTQHIPRTCDCPRTDADRRASGSDRPRTLTSETGERLRPSEGMGCDTRTYHTGTGSSWHSGMHRGREAPRVTPSTRTGERLRRRSHMPRPSMLRCDTPRRTGERLRPKGRRTRVPHSQRLGKTGECLGCS
jgi:hypothetical protein